jgi:hypothetical protein
MIKSVHGIEFPDIVAVYLTYPGTASGIFDGLAGICIADLIHVLGKRLHSS